MKNQNEFQFVKWLFLTIPLYLASCMGGGSSAEAPRINFSIDGNDTEIVDNIQGAPSDTDVVSVTKGEAISFKDISEIKEISYLIRNWDFGNGTTTSETKALYVFSYDEIGDYTVELCFDEYGCVRKYIRVTEEEAAPPPPAPVSVSQVASTSDKPVIRKPTISPEERARQKEQSAWSTAQAISSISSFSNYLNQYNNGIHASEARAKIDELEALAAEQQRLAAEVAENRRLEEKERQEQLAETRAKEEERQKRLEEERKAAEVERQRLEAEKRKLEAAEAKKQAEIEAERKRLEEEERRKEKAIAEAKEAKERIRLEAERKAAEEKRLKLEAEERKRIEAEAKKQAEIEAERKRLAEEEERLRKEAEARAKEEERLRLEAEQAAKEEERRRLEEEQLAREEADNTTWNRVKNANVIDAYEAYIKEYPDGLHVAEANSAIKVLKEEANTMGSAIAFIGRALDASGMNACTDFSISTTTIELTPKRMLALMGATVYSTGCGTLSLQLSGGNVNETDILELTESKNQLSFDNIGIELEAGKTYTLTLSTKTSNNCGSAAAPQLLNGESCGKGSKSDESLTLNTQGKQCLFKIKYQY